MQRVMREVIATRENGTSFVLAAAGNILSDAEGEALAKVAGADVVEPVTDDGVYEPSSFMRLAAEVVDIEPADEPAAPSEPEHKRSAKEKS